MGVGILEKARRKLEEVIRERSGRGSIPFGVQAFNAFELIEDTKSRSGATLQEIFNKIPEDEKTEPEDKDASKWQYERVIEVRSKPCRYIVLRHTETRRARIKRDSSLDSASMFHNNGRVSDAFKLMAYSVWAARDSHSVTVERQAERKLRMMISRDQWRQYVLTGTFFEQSKRSGKKYWFRRCAPIIVSATYVHDDGEKYSRPFVALCLHPHGYYLGTTVGALCPTDNIIAELLLMRTDEPMLWKKATHHELDEPNARL